MKNKLKKGLILLRGIFNYNLLRYTHSFVPTELQINVTYRCNSRCQMCHIWQMKPRNELNFWEWQKILQDPIFKGIKRLAIAGGEPTLLPDTAKLVKLYVDSMPQLQFLNLVTNGFLPKATIALVKDLVTLTLRRGINLSIAVSLDGIGEMHEVIRGVPQAFEKAKTTILALKALRGKYDFWLGVASVICRENLGSVKDVKSWCMLNDIPHNFQLVGFHETYVQNMSEKDELDFKEEDLRYLLPLLKELASNRSWREPRSFLQSYYWSDMLEFYKGGLRTTPCPFTLDAFVIDSLGDVYYCLSERKIGNCRRGNSVSEIYFDPKNLLFRRQLTKDACLKCNSACFVNSAMAKDFKKLAWFYFTGRIWPFS